MKLLKQFLADERGATDLVFRLVLAITIAASVLVILLQILHQTQKSGNNAAKTVGDGMEKFAENVSKELSG